MKRIFIAVDIMRDIREIIYKFAQKQYSYSDDIKLIARENLHITFKFLGNIEDKEIISIKEIIKGSISGFKSFKYYLEDDIGAFPDKRRARIFFIGIGEGRKKFNDIHKSIETGLDGLGIIGDRRSFCPHITIARTRTTLNIEESASVIGPIFPGVLKCCSVSLYRSILESDGVKYINIGRFSLK